MLAIVSMTSWKKRIENVSRVVFSILQNSVIPYKIICNLAIEEFPNKEKDLPKELLILEKNTCFEINWVEKNTKVFKKFIPTLKKFYGKDYVLFTIDDDEIYAKDYIKTGLEAIKKYDCCVVSKRDDTCKNVWGGFFVCKAKIFKPYYWENITEELINVGMNDPYTDLYLKYNNFTIHNVYYNSRVSKYNEVFPNRGKRGGAYSKERKDLAIEISKKILKEYEHNI